MAEVRAVGWQHLPYELVSQCIDPLTKQPLQEAYTTSCEHTFSQISIEHLFKNIEAAFCPLCERLIKRSDCQPNNALQRLVNTVLNLPTKAKEHLSFLSLSEEIKKIANYPFSPAKFKLLQAGYKELHDREIVDKYIEYQFESSAEITSFQYFTHLNRIHSYVEGYQFTLSFKSISVLLCFANFVRDLKLFAENHIKIEGSTKLLLTTSQLDKALEFLKTFVKNNQLDDKGNTCMQELLNYKA